MAPEKLRQRKPPTRYPEWYQRQICDEYIQTGVSMGYLREKYKINGKGCIYQWLRKFGYETSSPIDIGKRQSKLIMSKMDKVNEEELKTRIKMLERELEDEKLRAHMYSRMIDIAEDQFNIKIRKKSDTK